MEEQGKKRLIEFMDWKGGLHFCYKLDQLYNLIQVTESFRYKLIFVSNL